MAQFETLQLAWLLTDAQADYDALLALLKSQNRSEQDCLLVSNAYLYACHQHLGQKRKSGEDYITHPVQVARILAEIPLDTSTVVSAILHDTLEDTAATPQEMTQYFGVEIVHLVEGVTKLGKLQFNTQEDRQAENFRKMFLAMAHDVRVILLKLADRLHNMRTMGAMNVEKQQKKAKETLEIFAPLANRLGMGNIRAELEDTAFRILLPEAFEALQNALEQTQADRKALIDEVTRHLGTQLETMGIEVHTYSRLKNYYSIYKKLQLREKNLSQVFDISAIRIIVSSEKECYEALGLVHNAYTPIPGRFKDYIAMPKNNFYQSLHTSIMAPGGMPIEIQIRTQAMHHVAEYGIAAHWQYKERQGRSADQSSGEAAIQRDQLSWLKQLMELKDQSDSAQSFVDSVKLDLFQDQVFVFSPKGRVVDLPRGSTPVDFAYRIHTEVGNTCVGATVNGKIVPLTHELSNGDIVDIHTSKKATPKLDWIKFVQTQQAKGRIRQWFKRNMREEHLAQGRALLDAMLTRAQVEQLCKNGSLLEIAKAFNYNTIDDLFAAMGYGETTLPKVMNRLKKLLDEREEKAVGSNSDAADEHEPVSLNRFRMVKNPDTQGNSIAGLKGMLHHLAKCCMPVPGDEIVGVVTRSRGVMVHRQSCQNLTHVNPERVLNIASLSENTNGQSLALTASNPQHRRRTLSQPLHTVRLQMLVVDRVGMLKDILTVLVDWHSNVTDTRVKLNTDGTSVVDLTIEVTDMGHLEKIQTAMSRLEDTISVKRI